MNTSLLLQFLMMGGYREKGGPQQTSIRVSLRKTCNDISARRFLADFVEAQSITD